MSKVVNPFEPINPEGFGFSKISNGEAATEKATRAVTLDARFGQSGPWFRVIEIHRAVVSDNQHNNRAETPPIDGPALLQYINGTYPKAWVTPLNETFIDSVIRRAGTAVIPSMSWLQPAILVGSTAYALTSIAGAFGQRQLIPLILGGSVVAMYVWTAAKNETVPPVKGPATDGIREAAGDPNIFKKLVTATGTFEGAVGKYFVDPDNMPSVVAGGFRFPLTLKYVGDEAVIVLRDDVVSTALLSAIVTKGAGTVEYAAYDARTGQTTVKQNKRPLELYKQVPEALRDKAYGNLCKLGFTEAGAVRVYTTLEPEQGVTWSEWLSQLFGADKAVAKIENVVRSVDPNADHRDEVERQEQFLQKIAVATEEDSIKRVRPVYTVKDSTFPFSASIVAPRARYTTRMLSRQMAMEV